MAVLDDESLLSEGPSDDFVASSSVRTRPNRLAWCALCAAAALATFYAVSARMSGSASVADSVQVIGLDDEVKAAQIAKAAKTNFALILLKPHAVTDKVISLVHDYLAREHVAVIKEGRITAEVIAQKHLVDEHYGTLAAKAMTENPANMLVKPNAADLFEKTFNISWKDAVAQGLLFNAAGACNKLGVSHDDLGKLWHPLRLGNDKVKLGPGFYVGKVNDIFVVNGFYMDMLKTFIAPGSAVHYLQVEWAAQTMHWRHFLKSVIGEFEPEKSEPGSLRHEIWKDWEALGLPVEPNIRDNSIIASSSPFDALSERVNWLGDPLSHDAFLEALLAYEIPLHRIKAWLHDPVVNFRGLPENIFDVLEGLDAKECLTRLAEIERENFGGTHH